MQSLTRVGSWTFETQRAFSTWFWFISKTVLIIGATARGCTGMGSFTNQDFILFLRIGNMRRSSLSARSGDAHSEQIG